MQAALTHPRFGDPIPDTAAELVIGAHTRTLAADAAAQAAQQQASGYDDAVAGQAGEDFEPDVHHAERAIEQMSAQLAQDTAQRAARIGASLDRLRRLSGFRVQDAELKVHTLRALGELVDATVAELLEEIANDIEELAS